MTNLKSVCEEIVQKSKINGTKLSQGTLLLTKETRKWSVSERLLGDAQERRKVFSNFTSQDEGRSRVHVADFCDESDANYYVLLSNNANKLAQAVLILSEALVKIENTKKFTRLADCCVEKSCHLHTDTGTCSFQTGVYYGNCDRAAEAQEALAKAEELFK